MDGVADLEDEHAPADVLADAEGGVDGRDERRVHGRVHWGGEVHGQGVEELADDIIGLIQRDKQVIRLREVVVSDVWHNEHLRLFERASQVEVIEAFVEG